MSLIAILLVGFLLGMKHATDADHMAAVATLATDNAGVGQTIRQGVAWGIGHTLTLMMFGGLVLALGKTVPPALAQALEAAVAVMLIALGLNVLRRLVRRNVHFHVHGHPGDARQTPHFHAHSHNDGQRIGNTPRSKHALEAHEHPHGVPLRALVIGMMHGMAGTSALILLSLDAVQSLATGLAYIAVFGIGSVVGMALLSLVIAVPLRLSAASRLTGLHQGVTAVVGVAGCACGVLMIFRM